MSIKFLLAKEGLLKISVFFDTKYLQKPIA